MKLQKKITNSALQTRFLGQSLGKKILKLPVGKTGIVLGLKGNLGGGKTTFLQGFAKGLGVKEKILSPTFVILKHFKITESRIQNSEFRIPTGSRGSSTAVGINSKFQIPNSKFTDFYHIDCYRIKNEKDILELGWKEIIADPKNIIAVEWPEKIKKVFTKKHIAINFKFIDEKKRELTFKL